MGASLGPDSREIALNELLVAIREADIQFQAAAESLNEAEGSRIFQHLATMCQEQSQRLEGDIRQLGYLPKDMDTDRASLEEFIVKIEGQFSILHHALHKKTMTILNELSRRVEDVMQSDIPEDLAAQLNTFLRGIERACSDLPKL